MKKLFAVFFASIGCCLTMSPAHAENCGTYAMPSSNANCLCPSAKRTGVRHFQVGVYLGPIKDGTVLPSKHCDKVADSIKPECTKIGPVIHFGYISKAFVQKNTIHCRVEYTCVYRHYQKLSYVRSFTTQVTQGTVYVRLPKTAFTSNQAMNTMKSVATKSCSLGGKRPVRVDIVRYQCNPKVLNGVELRDCTVVWRCEARKENVVYWCKER